MAKTASRTNGRQGTTKPAAPRWAHSPSLQEKGLWSAESTTLNPFHSLARLLNAHLSLHYRNHVSGMVTLSNWFSKLATFSEAQAGQMRRDLREYGLEEEFSHILHKEGKSYRITRFGSNLLSLMVQLHDIGKCFYSDITIQPRRLTEEEKVALLDHPILSYFLIKQAEKSKWARFLANVALQHHEWYDGRGYPVVKVYSTDRKGEKILLFARITAVIDVVSAIIHPRPYKMEEDIDTAIEKIGKGAGTQFDPQVCNQAFVMLKNRRARRAIVRQVEDMRVSGAETLMEETGRSDLYVTLSKDLPIVLEMLLTEIGVDEAALEEMKQRGWQEAAERVGKYVPGVKAFK